VSGWLRQLVFKISNLVFTKYPIGYIIGSTKGVDSMNAREEAQLVTDTIGVKLANKYKKKLVMATRYRTYEEEDVLAILADLGEVSKMALSIIDLLANDFQANKMALYSFINNLGYYNEVEEGD
jgi:hypothetical protein